MSDQKDDRDDETIRMGVADPSFTTDKRVREAFDFAIESGCTHYSPAKGFDENILPRSISEFYESFRLAKIDPLSEIKITHGGQEALSLALHTTLKPGDEIIVSDPTYSSLLEKLPIFEARPVFVPLIEDEHWRLDIDGIASKITEKTKMIFVCNPNNPTGTVCTKDEMESLSDILKENKQVSILLDECYSRILYGGISFYSLLDDESVREQIFVVNSFSKTFAMTGWHLGFVISSKGRIDKIKTYAFDYRGGLNYAVQYAGAAALTECSSFVESMKIELNKRRVVMQEGLSKISNIKFEVPAGGFEIFPDCSYYSNNSAELSMDLARKEKVSTLPGSRFGPNGEGHLRLVFCSETSERISDGISRIGSFLSEIR